MREPSDILREEHEVITHLLQVVSAMASTISAGQPVPREDLDAVLDIVVNFADKCHHAKEEHALFPVLSKADPNAGALLSRRLEGDHKAARKLVRALRDLVPGVVAGDQSARTQFAKSARAYVAILEAHIEAETAELLPMADTRIPDRERALLMDEFERIEREEAGEGVHERYEVSIHRLADRYVHTTAAQ